MVWLGERPRVTAAGSNVISEYPIVEYYFRVRVEALQAAGRRVLGSFLILSTVLCASGCATGPVEETRAFADAVKAVKSATDLIWDELNVAERVQQLKRLNRTKGSRATFAVRDAYYYSSIAEAPATTSFRKAFVVIQDYATLLLVLVEGQNVAAARGQLEAFAGTIGTLAGSPEVGSAVRLLAPLIDQALQAANIYEARRLVVQGSPYVSQLIAALRTAAPDIFATLISDMQAGIVVDPATGKKIDAYRVTVANYVVLLDRLQVAFDQLLPGFERASSPATLAALVRLTAGLNADVDAIRKVLVLARR